MTLQTIFNHAQLTFVDCGASYFPPDTWQIALREKSSKLILVDPNVQNLEYHSKLQCHSHVIPKPLWMEQGMQTLYVANTDSGSSLLAPTGRPEILQADQGYFLPLTMRSIYCSTLAVELDLLNIELVDCIKLDTQGSELQILMGLDSQRIESLLFVEVEVSLQNPPLYSGASTLQDFSDFLEGRGFEIANLRLSRPAPTSKYSLPIPSECDVLFVRPFHLLGALKSSRLIMLKLLVLANLYYLYEYADQLCNYLRDSGLIMEDDLAAIMTSQSELRLVQGNYLANGGLSLWHRDSV